MTCSPLFTDTITTRGSIKKEVELTGGTHRQTDFRLTKKGIPDRAAPKRNAFERNRSSLWPGGLQMRLLRLDNL